MRSERGPLSGGQEFQECRQLRPHIGQILGASEVVDPTGVLVDVITPIAPSAEYADQFHE